MSTRYDAVARDLSRTRSQADRSAAELRRMQQEDVVVTSGRRLILQAPNGTYYALTVSNTGALSAVTTAAPV